MSGSYLRLEDVFSLQSLAGNEKMFHVWRTVASLIRNVDDRQMNGWQIMVYHFEPKARLRNTSNGLRKGYDESPSMTIIDTAQPVL